MKERTSLPRWTPRRLLSLLMALIMTLSLLPTAALAAATDYTINVTDAPDQLITKQQSADITATLKNASPTGQTVGLRLTVSKSPSDPGDLSTVSVNYNLLTSPVNAYGASSVSSIDLVSKNNVAAGGSISDKFNLTFGTPGKYLINVDAVEDDGSGGNDVHVLYHTTITVKDAIESLTVDPTTPEAGKPFTVTAMTNVDNGKILFKYGSQFETVEVLPMGYGTGYARHTFTAETGEDLVTANLFGAVGNPDTKTATLTVTAPAANHTVTFRANGDNVYTLPAPQPVKHGEKAVEPIAPERKGYTFDGWYKDAACTNTAKYDFATAVNANLELYAKWTATPVTIEITKDTADVTVFPPPTPGSTTSTLSGAIGKTANFTVTVPAKYDTANMIVQAGIYGGEHQYLVPESQSIDSTTGAVKFHYQLRVTEDIVVRYGGVLKVPVHVGAVTEKTFNVTLPTGDGFDAAFTNLTPTTNNKFTTVNYDGTVSFTVTPRTGYTVEGVYANGQRLTLDTTTGIYTIEHIKSNQAVMVDMAAVQFHTVTYVLDGAQMATQSVANGSPFTTLSAPVKTGYNWNTTWYTDATYDTPFTGPTVIEDTILYGRYTPIEVSISYDPKGGSWPGGTAPASVTKTYGLAATLTEIIPTKDGCTFLGWSESDTATAASYLPGATFSKEIDRSITLYAVWQKNTYTITFSSGEGYTLHSGGSMTVEHGGKFEFNLIVDPAYAEKAPSVWTNTAGISGGTEIHPDPSVSVVTKSDGAKVYYYKLTNITADTAVNALVTANATYTVTFMTNGTTYQTQQVEFNHKATQPVDPKVEGYTFGGWYKNPGCADADKWNFATDTVTGPTTLYAKLTPIEPVITWPTTTTGYTIAVKYTAPGAPSAADLTTNGSPVPYNSVVTFTITISKGYDASKMKVGINGVLLSPTDITGDTYTYEFIAKENTEITVVGVERKTVTIIYNDNGGYGGPVQETVNYFLPSDVHNGKISETVPTREGYDFMGWSTDNKATWDATTGKITHEAGVTATDLKPGEESPFTSDTVLYAVWQAKETGIKLEVSNTIDDTATSKAQYEGENVTLTATVTSAGSGASVTTGSVQFYRCTDADPTLTTATWTLLDSKVVSGGTATYKAETSGFKYGDTNKDTYKAVFIPTEGNGYTKITSATEAVKVMSSAISWKLDAATKIDDKANALTITDKNGGPVTAMVAGQVYTLELPAIYALDEQNTKLTVNKDYSVTWQYRDANGVWTDYTNSGSDNTTTVDAAYSQYVFRAVVTPVTGATSHFTKAAKYDTSALEKDQYETALISEPTTAVDLQKTTTELAITGADNEENDVYINGTQPFNATAGSHLAQFEGQKVTLTATVTDASNAAVTKGYVDFYKDGETTPMNEQPIAIGQNGTATYEATTSAFSGDAITAKDTYYAVYLSNDTYSTSDSKTTPQTVYIKSTEIAQPVLKSKLAGKRGGADANTTAGDNLTELLAGVQHTFSLVETGAQAKVDGVDGQFSVVAKDGRTVDANNYTVEWLKTTGSNEQKLDVAENIKTVNVDDNKVGDKYRIKLIPQNYMKVGEVSNYAIIGTKQGVKVTVKASADRVYQLNEITLTAEVAAADSAATMQPKGSVTFYYSVDGGTTWTKIGDTKDLAETAGIMTASITTKELPVEETKNTKQDVEITAVYEGNETFKESATVTTTGASHTIAATTNCTTTNKIVTVYSSVVYVDSAENTTNTPGTHGIAITTEGGKVLANETKVNLKLSEVYTLDHATDAADKALLAYGTDYTVQWQMLSNAAAYPDKAAKDTAWKNITSATGTTCQIDVVQGAAYRAVITVNDTPIAKGSFTEVTQAISGRKVYYSNILVAANAPATLTVNVNTSNTSKGYEGIVEGETVTIHTFTSGATGTTPISQLTVNIYPGKPAEVAAATTPVAPVFTAEKADVNGHVSFDWNKDVTPGYYTLKVKATFTNGYDDKEITRTLIVRDNDYKFELSGDNAVYNGKVQGLKVTVADMGIEDALAQKSVVVYYYTDEARTQQVEPTQAGTYYATVRLQESAYWTEKTFPATFTIKPREVSVVDLVAQAKVYDGTINANIQEIILNDAEVNSTTGLPTDDKGIIDGDSVYAVGTGYTSLATAGTAKLGVKDVSLKGDDAANYDLTSYSYTEDFNIQRSQVKGAIVSGRTYKYTGKDIKLAASDIYLIDQAGNQLTNYEVTYYYHNGDGVEKVDAMNKMGKYTVIARPEQDNYKGGATETVYVGTTDNAGTLVTNAVSSLITISNTVKVYDGQATGVTATATKGTASASYYYDGAWKDTAPTAAGRYLVKATVTNDGVTDTAYGIYTIVKARPEFTPTTNKASMEYTSGRYDGTVDAGFVNGKSDDTAETYITYTGGTIQGVAYEAPTEVGKYIATVHVGETANYTAHEKQVAFEITPKALTITADDISRQQYGAYPDLTASFKGLATGGVAADTSLRDVQIQPELIDDSNYTNDASDQVGNNYSITAVAALARNYDVSYVKGNMSVTREDPKPYLEIRGMIENGDGATDLAYYGDVIQLYAYGNQIKTTTGDVHNTSSILAWSVTGPATITQDGLLTVKGVGDVTVTLKRGIGAQQISTDLTFKAKKQEVKVVVPDQDLVYNGAEQKYDGGKFYAENTKGERITATPYMHDGKVKRTNVGSQIITSWVGDTNATYQSEHYCGLFTINVKDVTVKPKEISVIYGDALGTLDYSEPDIIAGIPALTDGKAVSERKDYINLDVLDGYEILVAGKENENYNVKYVTDQDAPDVKVTAKALTISTGTLNEQTGMTSGSLNPMGKHPVNGSEVNSAIAMGDANVRMYGEPNWVMDYKLDEHELITGDTLADLAALGDKLVKFNYNIGADANVEYNARTTFLPGKSKYDVETNDSMMAFKNYAETYTLGTQNIYQRPVELKLRDSMTQLNAYKPTIMPGGTVDETVLRELIINNLIVTQHNNEGGLAELLKHTIKNLDIKILYALSGDTITVTVTIGNQNYYLANGPVTVPVKVDPTKIVAKYGPLGWTSASVTMVGVNEHGAETGATYVTGDVWYMIYTKDTSVADKYSNYKDKTPVRKVKMTKGSSTGVYIANYDSLPAGEYVMFAIAEGYTIIE